VGTPKRSASARGVKPFVLRERKNLLYIVDVEVNNGK